MSSSDFFELPVTVGQVYNLGGGVCVEFEEETLRIFHTDGNGTAGAVYLEPFQVRALLHFITESRAKHGT